MNRRPVDPARFVEEPGFTPAEMASQVVLALAYSPDGKLLATAGEDNAIRLHDVDFQASSVDAVRDTTMR